MLHSHYANVISRTAEFDINLIYHFTNLWIMLEYLQPSPDLKGN